MYLPNSSLLMGVIALCISYQMAEIVFDATVAFCDRFIDRRSRTHDQMVQAARSGKQNIVEGSMASGTSKKPNLNSLAWQGQVWRSYWSIFKIFLDKEACPFGGKTMGKLEK